MPRPGRTALAALLLAAAPAAACPVCDRPAGRAVRAGIFDADFAPTLLATLLPFVAPLGAAAALHLRRPDRERSRP